MINIFYRIVGSKRVALILDCIGIAFGAVIAAFAIEEFLVPCTILDDGVVGIGIMINSLAHIPLGILTIVFNIPFLAVGSRQLGKPGRRPAVRRSLRLAVSRQRFRSVVC